MNVSQVNNRNVTIPDGEADALFDSRFNGKLHRLISGIN